MERSIHKENGKNETSINKHIFEEKEKGTQEGENKEIHNRKKEKRHEKEKTQQKEIHDVSRKTIKKKKVGTKQKYR